MAESPKVGEDHPFGCKIQIGGYSSPFKVKAELKLKDQLLYIQCDTKQRSPAPKRDPVELAARAEGMTTRNTPNTLEKNQPAKERSPVANAARVDASKTPSTPPANPKNAVKTTTGKRANKVNPSVSVAEDEEVTKSLLPKFVSVAASSAAQVEDMADIVASSKENLEAHSKKETKVETVHAAEEEDNAQNGPSHKTPSTQRPEVGCFRLVLNLKDLQAAAFIPSKKIADVDHNLWVFETSSRFELHQKIGQHFTQVQNHFVALQEAKLKITSRLKKEEKQEEKARLEEAMENCELFIRILKEKELTDLLILDACQDASNTLRTKIRNTEWLLKKIDAGLPSFVYEAIETGLISKIRYTANVRQWTNNIVDFYPKIMFFFMVLEFVLWKLPASEHFLMATQWVGLNFSNLSLPPYIQYLVALGTCMLQYKRIFQILGQMGRAVLPAAKWMRKHSPDAKANDSKKVVSRTPCTAVASSSSSSPAPVENDGVERKLTFDAAMGANTPQSINVSSAGEEPQDLPAAPTGKSKAGLN